MNATSDTVSDSADADDSDHTADARLRTVARLLNLSPLEVREALDSAADDYSPECLKYYEFDSYASLPAERKAHAQHCQSCSDVKTAMDIAPQRDVEGRLDDFSRVAAGSSSFGPGGPRPR